MAKKQTTTDTNFSKDCLNGIASGMVFGRLTVVSTCPRPVGKTTRGLWWKCICSCRKEHAVVAYSLRNGSVRSCGCLREENRIKSITKHGQSSHKTVEYNAWRNMISRCYNSNFPSFHRYGGRGLSVCEEWLHDFSAFLSDMGKCPKGKTLDRKDNEIGYCPDNCRWASRKEQSNNRSNNRRIEFGGHESTIAEISQELGVSWYFVRDRIRSGKSILEVVIDARMLTGEEPEEQKSPSG